MTSNLEEVEAFPSAALGMILFGFDDHTRQSSEDAYYDINASNLYAAIGFDVAAYDPESGPGLMEVFFSDGTQTSRDISQTGTEFDPIFPGFGLGVEITCRVYRPRGQIMCSLQAARLRLTAPPAGA